jgi:hypothetical protein
MSADLDDDSGVEVPGGEAASDLRALENMAAGDPDALAAAAGDEAEPVAVRAPLAEELAGLLQMLAGMAAPVFPSLTKIYTPETCAAVGGAVGAVCDKHGWLQGGVGGEWGPEIMCVAVVGPIGYATVLAVRNDMAANEARNDARLAQQGRDKLRATDITEPPVAAPGAAVAPGARTVTMGTVMP